MYLGDFPINATVDFKWSTQGADGSSITRATNGSIRIYKNNSTTQRTSAAGITDTEDFDDPLTGVHHLRIDLSDNTDSGFYAAGNEYQVVLQGAVIDGSTINAVLAHFSIERANGALALLKATGSVKVDVVKWNSNTVGSQRFRKNVSARFAILMLDTGGNPATGLTVTATRSLDGGSFGAAGATVTEIANGWYDIQATSGDLNGDSVAWRFTATGCRDGGLNVITEA